MPRQVKGPTKGIKLKSLDDLKDVLIGIDDDDKPQYEAGEGHSCYRCRRCQHPSSGKAAAGTHMRQRHLKTGLQCPFCDHLVWSPGAMRTHVANHHGEAGPEGDE